METRNHGSLTESEDLFRTTYVNSQMEMEPVIAAEEENTAITTEILEIDIVLPELLGQDLILHDGHGSEDTVSYSKGLIETGTKVIGLYFGDHSNDKCRGFVSLIAQKSKTKKAKGYPIEIVYIPTAIIEAEDIEDLKEAHGDWLSIKHDAHVCAKLIKHYDVDNIPSLIFVNHHAEVLDEHGLTLVMNDPCEAAVQLMLLYHQNEMERCIRESNNFRKERLTLGMSSEPAGKVSYMETSQTASSSSDGELQQLNAHRDSTEVEHTEREKDEERCCKCCEQRCAVL